MSHPAPEASPWNLPNALTVLRLVVVPVFGWALLSHPHDAAWRIGATALFVLGMLTDLLDGRIARARGLVTTFGKLVDPIADKALTGMAFVGLSLLGELWWWVTIVVLVREWGITLVRMLVVRHGVISANKGGKAKTMTQTLALIWLLLPWPLLLRWPGWGVMAAAVVLTVVTGVAYVREALRVRAAGLRRERDAAGEAAGRGA